MTDSELSQTQKIFNYDANSGYTGAVPNDCKFRVSARYYNPDDFEEDTNGAVIVTFGKVEFTLTDHLAQPFSQTPHWSISTPSFGEAIHTTFPTITSSIAINKVKRRQP